MRFRLLVVLSVSFGCAVIACSDAYTAPQRAGLSGTYSLISINTRTLPLRAAGSDTVRGSLKVLAIDTLQSEIESTRKDLQSGITLGTIALDYYLVTRPTASLLVLRSLTSGRIDSAFVTADTIVLRYATGLPSAQIRVYRR